MSKFKLRFIINCICFTYIILCLCILVKMGIFKDVTVNEILYIFLMTTLIQIIMYFTDKLPVNNIIFVNFIRIFDIFIVVFPLSLIFGIFDFSIRNLLIVSTMNITVYLLVCLIILTKTKYYAFSINEKINKRMLEKEVE